MPRPADGVTLRSLTVYGTQYIVELARISKGVVTILLPNKSGKYVRIAEVNLPKDFNLMLKSTGTPPRKYFLRVLRYLDLYLKAQAEFRTAEVQIQIFDEKGHVIDDSSRPNPCAVSLEKEDFRTLAAKQAVMPATDKKKPTKTKKDDEDSNDFRWA